MNYLSGRGQGVKGESAAHDNKGGGHGRLGSQNPSHREEERSCGANFVTSIESQASSRATEPKPGRRRSMCHKGITCH